MEAEKNSYTEYLQKQRVKDAKLKTSHRESKPKFSMVRKYKHLLGNRENPQLEIKPQVLDFVLIFLGYLALAILWLATWYVVSISPEIVPIHFGSGGKADGFGSPQTHWWLPIIATVIFAVLTFSPIRKPWLANYPVKITLENAERQYRLLLRMFHILKIAISLSVLSLLMNDYQASKMAEPKLNAWFAPAMLCVFVPVIGYIISAMTEKKHKKGI